MELAVLAKKAEVDEGVSFTVKDWPAGVAPLGEMVRYVNGDDTWKQGHMNKWPQPRNNLRERSVCPRFFGA